MFVVAQTPGGEYYWKHSKVKDYRELPSRDSGMIRVRLHNNERIIRLDAASISIDPYYPWELLVGWERGLPINQLDVAFRSLYEYRK